MTAAASSRDVSATRPSRSKARSSEYDDLPVLLRLPNLRREAEHKQPELSETSSTHTAELANDLGKNNQQGRRGTERGAVADEQVHAQPKTSGSQVLSLLWRIGVVAAAIALIVLAYRIINGPPVPAEVSAPDLDNLPALDERHDEIASTDPMQLSPAPRIVTPNLTSSTGSRASEGDELGAPAEFPPGTPSGDTHGIASAGETLSPTGEHSESTPNFATMPLGMSPEEIVHSDPDSWDSDNNQRPWSDNAAGESWDTASELATEPNDEQFGDIDAGAYPLSDPGTWRTAEQWYLTAEAAALEEERGSSEWQDNERSAARLRPEIEHPPLPRDHLR